VGLTDVALDALRAIAERRPNAHAAAIELVLAVVDPRVRAVLRGEEAWPRLATELAGELLAERAAEHGDGTAARMAGC
jgi:hypothetical protein